MLMTNENMDGLWQTTLFIAFLPPGKFSVRKYVPYRFTYSDPELA